MKIGVRGVYLFCRSLDYNIIFFLFILIQFALLDRSDLVFFELSHYIKKMYKQTLKFYKDMLISKQTK